MTTFLVRKTGSALNGGTSAAIRQQGTDAVISGGGDVLTAASANFTAADVGHVIGIQPAGGGAAGYRRIITVNSPTQVVLHSGGLALTGGRPWVLGGAWDTIGVFLNNVSNLPASGDTCYVGAGRYPEAVATVGITPVAETKVIADVSGAHTGDPGPVIWTCFGNGDNAVANLLRCLSTSGKSFLTFEDFIFVGGTSAAGSMK